MSGGFVVADGGFDMRVHKCLHRMGNDVDA